MAANNTGQLRPILLLKDPALLSSHSKNKIIKYHILVLPVLIYRSESQRIDSEWRINYNHGYIQLLYHLRFASSNI